MDKKSLPPLTPLANTLVPSGTYQHYKGNFYKAVGVARHSETLEEMVIYQDSNHTMWARPLKMFFEEIEFEGSKRPRFKFIDL